MLRAPILIGAPVAFLPVPIPQTAFVALALPDPTTPADVLAPAPIAATAASTAIVPTAARATPAVTFLDLIHFLLLGSPRGYRHGPCVEARSLAGGPPPTRSAHAKRLVCRESTWLSHYLEHSSHTRDNPP